MGNYSSFLFAEPTFIEGMARLWDFGDTLTEYNYSSDGFLADTFAMHSDWLALYEDFSVSLERLREECSHLLEE